MFYPGPAKINFCRNHEKNKNKSKHSERIFHVKVLAEELKFDAPEVVSSSVFFLRASTNSKKDYETLVVKIFEYFVECTLISKSSTLSPEE